MKRSLELKQPHHKHSKNKYDGRSLIESKKKSNLHNNMITFQREFSRKNRHLSIKISDIFLKRTSIGCWEPNLFQDVYNLYKILNHYLFSQKSSIIDVWQGPIYAPEKQSLEEFCKKCVLKNTAKFTGKRLCQSFFLNKVAGLTPAISVSQNATEWLLLVSDIFVKLYVETSGSIYSFFI